MCTSPTGFSSVPPAGPAIPVMPNPMVAPVRWRIPAAIAVDASENIWTGDNFDGIATEFTPGSGTYNPTQYTNANLASGNALGIDANGSIWVVSGSSNNLGEFSGPSNSYTNQNTYSGGGLNAPAALAIDGSGNIWIANGSGGSTILNLFGG